MLISKSLRLSIFFAMLYMHKTLFNNIKSYIPFYHWCFYSFLALTQKKKRLHLVWSNHFIIEIDWKSATFASSSSILKVPKVVRKDCGVKALLLQPWQRFFAFSVGFWPFLYALSEFTKKTFSSLSASDATGHGCHSGFGAPELRCSRPLAQLIGCLQIIVAGRAANATSRSKFHSSWRRSLILIVKSNQ